jgi:hypothetical protein
LIKKKHIRYFIDLHGLSNQHNFDIGIYYKNKFLNSKKLAFNMANKLNAGELKHALVYVKLFKDNTQETLAEYVCSKLNIPAIELEIAWDLLEDELLRNEFASILSKHINELS